MRKIYRYPDQGFIAGVCYGLAKYLGLNPFWVRLSFLTLFSTKLFGFIIYLLLIFVLPVKSRHDIDEAEVINIQK